jgi:hypothetical protein
MLPPLSANRTGAKSRRRQKKKKKKSGALKRLDDVLISSALGS